MAATIALLGYLPLNASAAMLSHQRNIMSELSGYEELQMDESATSGVNNATNSTDDAEFVLPYSYPEMVLIAIVAGFLSLLTVVGNCMVMISFKIDKQLQTISNYFLFSLAVADFAIGLISMPLFTVYILAGRWQLGPYVCDTWLSLDYLASNASVLNLLIISFDRYFSVTRPLTYRARRTPRRAGIMIAAAWVISLVLWPPWIYAWPYIEGDRKVPEDKCFIQFIETNNYITFGTAIAAFYAPVTVMCVLYWRVWRETEKRQKDLSNLQAGKKNDSHRSNSSGEEQAVLVTDGGFIGEHHHYRSGANSLNADWRRSRSESSGPVDDVDGYVAGGLHQRRNNGLWLLRRWLRFSAWQQWARNLGRQPQQRARRRGDDAESYSEGSNVVTTPASVETPIASSISRGTSMNLIRDPYSSTPVRYKAAAAAAAASDLRLISADRRRTLVSSRSLSQTEHRTDLRGSPLVEGADRDATGADANYEENELDPAKRSHSADSVFTILIRLPADSHASDNKSEHKVSIRMLPANVQRSRPNAGANQPAVRSRSVPVGNEQSYRPGANNYNHYNSSYSLHQSRSAAYNDSSSSLLCGTNLLPNAFSLGKLTSSLAKPTHLPLHKGKLKSHQASPWVPRSCMPVAQSPLIVRCTRFNSSSYGLDSPAARLLSDRTPSVLNVGSEAPRARPGALQTVSGSVANSAGTHPPVRRPNINQQFNSNANNKKANKKPKKKNQEKRQERKAAKTLSAILLAFILTWTPYNVLTLLKALAPCDKDDCFSSELWNFSYYLCYINSTINPVCYALCNASFRRTYVRILTCKWHSRTKTAVQRGVYN